MKKASPHWVLSYLNHWLLLSYLSFLTNRSLLLPTALTSLELSLLHSQVLLPPKECGALIYPFFTRELWSHLKSPFLQTDSGESGLILDPLTEKTDKVSEGSRQNEVLEHNAEKPSKCSRTYRREEGLLEKWTWVSILKLAYSSQNTLNHVLYIYWYFPLVVWDIFESSRMCINRHSFL